METFNCFVCGEEMKIRQGKYGEFFYCPKGKHGTIAVNKYLKIKWSFWNEKGGYAKNKHDPLMDAINMECSRFGSITELESFYIDSPECDPEDFWKDMRPY